jgi:adenine-specific DNA-methyltransferase
MVTPVKTARQVSAEKLRGGFYTPDRLVDVCYARIADHIDGPGLRLLEPSAGDGAFVRGLGRSPVRSAVGAVTAIEPMEIEAEKARQALADGSAVGEVLPTSAIAWAAGTEAQYDVAVGNPPFVRYQFLSPADRDAALRLGDRLGVRVAGVANLWIPVLLGALSRLRSGGAFAFVVPTECLTGISAAIVRRWLIDHCAEARLDLFPPGSFPEVLQEVTVLSGRREGGASGGELRLRMVEHLAAGDRLDWSHRIAHDGPWTRYLRAPERVDALETAARDPRVTVLATLVAFEVSIVTGANDFFTVSDDTLARHDLRRWARPLLPRIRHAPGLRYTAADHAATRAAGARAWVLDFAAGAPEPLGCAGPAGYLRTGEQRGLPGRYKCRIREPWYRVPGIVRGDLLLSKRSHLHPRVVLNEAGVFTTDTIYRGRMLNACLHPAAVAAAFHSSLTLLSAELEGRSFGGGVLELVPSEIGRLLVHADAPDAALLKRLDAVARAGDTAGLIAATDADLVARGLIEADVAAALASARRLLLARRLDRNRRPRLERRAEEAAAA